MSRQYKLFVQDILEAINKIVEFIGKMDFEQFYKDDMTRSAVVWKLHIIGEATKNIPKEIRNRYKGIPWKDMTGMRNKIAHFYFGIDYKIVWKVIK